MHQQPMTDANSEQRIVAPGAMLEDLGQPIPDRLGIRRVHRQRLEPVAEAEGADRKGRREPLCEGQVRVSAHDHGCGRARRRPLRG